MDKIILKPRREESLLRYHPWVFSGAIAQIVGHPAEGDLVSVCSADGKLLACGHYEWSRTQGRLNSVVSPFRVKEPSRRPSCS